MIMIRLRCAANMNATHDLDRFDAAVGNDANVMLWLR